VSHGVVDGVGGVGVWCVFRALTAFRALNHPAEARNVKLSEKKTELS